MTDNVDLQAVKQRQQATWSTGNYAAVGSRILMLGELLCEAADLRGGERVLDVATGNSNTALAAARRFCHVTGIDYVPDLLAQGRRRAEAEGLEVEFLEGDAEAIPFPDGGFDAVLSTIGAMFAPDHRRTAGELLRVCRPGGRVAMANWTADGYVGAFFMAQAKHVPPPPGVTSPLRWGDEAYVRELFGDRADVRATVRSLPMRFPSAEFYVDYMTRWFGPLSRAFEAVGPEGAPALRADMVDVVERYNTAADGTVVIHADYLELVATKR